MIIKYKTIKRTGINPDYVNEWVITVKRIASKYENEPEKTYNKLKILHPFKKYTDKTPSEDYNITEKNKRQVKFLDRIVDEMNDVLEDPSKFDCKRAKTLANRAIILIY